jgi:hypothetical protein
VAALAVEDVQRRAGDQPERDQLTTEGVPWLGCDEDDSGEGRRQEQHESLGGPGAEAERLREDVALDGDGDEQQPGERAGQAADRHPEVMPHAGQVTHLPEPSHCASRGSRSLMAAGSRRRR